jgi:hypothetical protein
LITEIREGLSVENRQKNETREEIERRERKRQRKKRQRTGDCERKTTLTSPLCSSSTKIKQQPLIFHSQPHGNQSHASHHYQADYSYFVGTFKSTPPPLGIYDTFPLAAKLCTIALLASILRNAMNASPAFSIAFEIVAAASASPSARITAA